MSAAAAHATPLRRASTPPPSSSSKTVQAATPPSPATSLQNSSPSPPMSYKTSEEVQQDKDDARYRKVFEELDLNANGSLDEHELQAGLQKMGLPSSEQQVHEMMAMCDRDRDGSISYVEFAVFAKQRENELRLLFDELDLNGNGLLEANEIRSALDKIGMGKEVSDDAIYELIGRMGVDPTKGINFEVFKRILMLFPARTLSIQSVFDCWFRQIIDTGDEVAIPDVADHPLRRLIAGGIAGAVSRTATAPFDRLKMLLQAQNSPAMLAAGLTSKAKPKAKIGPVPRGAVPVQAEYRGIWYSLKKIHADSGWRGFYKGNGTNIVKIAPESAVKFWAYETIKRMLCHDHTAPTMKEKLVAGSAAGAISQTIIYPLEITKTRLTVAKPGEYRGIWHCITSIVKQDGVLALFRGLLPSVVGVVPYAGVDFAVYSSLRDMYTKRYPDQHPGVFTVFLCGALSSTCGQVVAYPLQLVRTRLQTQGMAGRPMLYAGMTDAFYKIWKCDGLLGFYSGLLPNFMKAIPAVSISYIVYEQVSRGLGVSSGL